MIVCEVFPKFAFLAVCPSYATVGTIFIRRAANARPAPHTAYTAVWGAGSGHSSEPRRLDSDSQPTKTVIYCLLAAVMGRE